MNIYLEALIWSVILYAGMTWINDWLKRIGGK